MLLLREGKAVNRRWGRQIYREEWPTVRRCGGRMRATGQGAPIETPLAANPRWSLDFVSEQMTDGRHLRILTVIDNCTRECLALVADTSLSGRQFHVVQPRHSHWYRFLTLLCYVTYGI